MYFAEEENEIELFFLTFSAYYFNPLPPGSFHAWIKQYVLNT